MKNRRYFNIMKTINQTIKRETKNILTYNEDFITTCEKERRQCNSDSIVQRTKELLH